ncbi:transposase [Nostoc sp. NMS4]|uniref:transposase n=1 Tax=Nostoc sp. NMS4 TaxID=2815390 RepID=UPI0025EA2E51|nr:transposase [Nostoc sp. NMS4]
MIRQVEKHIIKEVHEWFDYCAEITTVSRQLYNTAQFTQRQGFFYGWGTRTQAKLDSLFKQDENYKALPAKVAQLVLKQNADASSFFCSLNPLHAAIDIGVDNLATIVFNDPTIQPIAVNGKPLKSANQFYNKQIAKFRGFLPSGKGKSRRITNIVRNRNNWRLTPLFRRERAKSGVA